jgi:hypothetical protein
VPPVFAVYSRNSRHLCADMIAALRSLQGGFHYLAKMS